MSFGQYLDTVFYQVHQQTANHIVTSVLYTLAEHTTDDVCTRDKMATVCVEAESSIKSGMFIQVHNSQLCS